MSSSRIDLSKLLHQIKSDLAEYIVKRKGMIGDQKQIKQFEILTKQEQGKFYGFTRIKHPYKEGLLAAVPENDAPITCLRILTIHDTLSLLAEEKESSKSLNQEQTTAKLVLLTQILINGRDANNKISSDWRKKHKSKQQNREEGQSLFSSWLNQSLFQSRANVAFETALERIKTFAKEHRLQLNLDLDKTEHKGPGLK